MIGQNALPRGAAAAVSLDTFDYVCMHSPYNKLVQKGFARLLFGDFIDVVCRIDLIPPGVDLYIVAPEVSWAFGGGPECRGASVSTVRTVLLNDEVLAIVDLIQ